VPDVCTDAVGDKTREEAIEIKKEENCTSRTSQLNGLDRTNGGF